jgi:predicted nuclease with TOPRIM domain
MEFRSQSQRLQDEMAGDVERLQDQLTEAEGEVDQVRANLVSLTRQAYDDREKYDLRMSTAKSKSREMERQLEASSVEALCLREALSVAHAKSERLNSVAEDMNKRYQAAASGECLLKLGLVEHRRWRS